MGTEIELKLSLSPAAARQLPAHPLLAGLPFQRQRLLNTYYDTPKRDLEALCVAVRFRKKGWQWLLTVKSAEPASGGLAQRSEWECHATPGNFDFAHVTSEDLRKNLENLAPQLQAIFTTHFQRTAWQVEFGASRIELALDRGGIDSQGRHSPICEIELELINGEIADLFALARQLQNDLPLRPMIASKAERGYALFSGLGAKPFKACHSPLHGGLTSVQAFRQVALSCLEHLQRNEILDKTQQDPEFVHQARVALRRMRSALKLFAPILPEDFVIAYGDVWKTLATALGEARNWDVFVAETLPPLAEIFPDLRDIERLRAEGRRRAKKAHQAVESLFASKEYCQVILSFTALLLALPDHAETTLDEFARQRLDRHAKKSRQLAYRLDQLNADDRHNLRIQLKKLRYTLEFFAPLMPRQRFKPYVAVLAQLQDELGLINDHITASALIEEVLGHRRPGPVHGWIAGRHALLIAEVPEALNIWLGQRPPWKQR